MKFHEISLHVISVRRFRTSIATGEDSATGTKVEGAAPLRRHPILTHYDTGKGADPDPLFGGREPESKPDPLPPGGSHRGRVSQAC